MIQGIKGMGWELHQALMEEYPDKISIGVGDDLEVKLGIPAEKISQSFQKVFDGLADGVGHVGFIDSIKWYGFKRNRSLDVGTKADFENTIFKDACDLLDKRTS